MIMGVSLGAPRVMRVVRRTHDQERNCVKGTHVPSAFEVLLLPGSVYVQRYFCLPFYSLADRRRLTILIKHCRDEVRYEFDHSIAAKDFFRSELVPPGQRLSIMLRVRVQLCLYFNRLP